jgi:hypothetical protein
VYTGLLFGVPEHWAEAMAAPAAAQTSSKKALIPVGQLRQRMQSQYKAFLSMFWGDRSGWERR